MEQVNATTSRRPGLVGAALLFWGWATGFWLLGVGLAAAAEARHLLGMRWTLADKDYYRLSDLAAVLTAGIGVYYFLTPGGESLLYLYLKLLPASLSPIVLAQLYSADRAVELSTFFYAFRRMKRKRPEMRMPRIDVVYPYLGLIVFCTAGVNTGSPYYFPAAMGLLLWGCLTARPNRGRLGRFAAMAFLAAALGLGVMSGVKAIQDYVYDSLRRWHSDPFKSSTAMGELGETKLSTAIHFRVRPGPADDGSGLLIHEAGYDAYLGKDWMATRREFRIVMPDIFQDGAWTVDPETDRRKQLTIVKSFRGRRDLVPVPKGTAFIAEMGAADLSKTELGTIRAYRPPGLAAYEIDYDPGASHQAPPEAIDLGLPNATAEAYAKIARALGLTADDPRDAALRLKRWFRTDFEYSLVREVVDDEMPPLLDFLLNTRRGHCEYFASGAVLLLRAAGIPARYAVGWAAQEWDPKEREYIVRYSHAHAWAQVWDGSTWRDVDTTPPAWFTAEQGQLPFWQGIADAISELRTALASWRWLKSEEAMEEVAKWVVGALVVYVVVRLWLDKGSGRIRLLRRRRRRASAPGEDSPFYEIERRLAKAGYQRPPGQPMQAWLADIGTNEDELSRALELHYRYRFDPNSLTTDERAELEREVAAWLRAHRGGELRSEA